MVLLFQEYQLFLISSVSVARVVVFGTHPCGSLGSSSYTPGDISWVCICPGWQWRSWCFSLPWWWGGRRAVAPEELKDQGIETSVRANNQHTLLKQHNSWGDNGPPHVQQQHRLELWGVCPGLCDTSTESWRTPLKIMAYQRIGVSPCGRSLPVHLS